MKLKRIMAIVLCFALVLSTMSFNVFAEDDIVPVSSLAELQEALAAENDLPIVITQTIEIPADETVELDLNGKTINADWADEAAEKHIYVLENKGKLEIGGEGVINTRGIFNYGELTLSGGTINAIDCNGGYGVINYSGSTFTMNDGTLAAIYEDGDPAESGNVDATALRIESGATATIADGSISSVSNFTYAVDNAGTLNVSGGTIKGRGGISVVGGSVTITDGNILNDIDNDATGHAVYVGSGNVKIEGGNFTATNDVNDGNSVVYVASGAEANITGGTFVTDENTKAPYGPEGNTISISGGNFDKAPADAYIADGYEFDEDGNVVESAPAETTVAKIGDTPYATLEEAIAKATESDTIELIADASVENAELEGIKLTIADGVTLTVDGGSLTGVSIEGTGTIEFNGTVNFYGDNTVTSVIGGYPFELIVNEGATLLISRFTLGYDRNITVYGDIEDAHEFVPTGKTPSLKFNSTSGVSVGGTGTGNITAKDAYIELGNSSWKNSQGTHTWSFENCYVSATSFGNNNAPYTASASWTVTFDNSELAAKNYIKTGPNVTYSFTNGSVAKTGSLRNDGVINIDETSSVTTTSQQNNVVGAVDEHGGNNGIVNVSGTLTIGSNAKTAFEMLGGTLNVDGGEVNLGNNTLTLDAGSKLTSSGDISGEITAADGAVIEITGGTYTTSNLPEEWVADGCELKNNGDGTFTVKGPVLSGKGAKEDPYKINNFDDLKAFRDSVNAGNTYEGKYVLLTDNINLAGEVWTPIGTSVYDKTPANAKMFAGNFDGGNHTIAGLTSDGYVPDAEDIGGGEYSFGLFGYVYGANISNVKLADVDIDCGTRKDSEGNDVAGSGVAALIGYYVIADEKACVIDNCHVLSGTVKASNNMGGLIGYMDAQRNVLTADITIKNCTNAADVTTEAREGGGILGLLNHSNPYGPASMYGNITFLNCSNTGDITALDGGGSTCAGGILGRDGTSHNYKNVTITFDNCSNSGTIKVHTSGESHVAGLGTVYNSDGSWLVIKDSKNTGDIIATKSGEVYAGGLMAYAGVATIENSTSTGTVTVGGEAGNKYIGSAHHILFLNDMDDFADTITGATYFLNGGTTPERSALWDDSGNFHLVETAYKDGVEFGGWYDNAGFNGEPYTALSSSVKTYYAKWLGPVAKIGSEEFDTIEKAFEAAKDGDVIELLTDITISNKLTVSANVVINGNNYTLKYTGTDRVIDIPLETASANVTIKDLTVIAKKANRGINYNTNGTLTVENVTVTMGKDVDSYAINFPASADNATVVIKDSELTARIPVNVWGSDMTISIVDTDITSVDTSDKYNYAGIQLNRDEYGNIAEGTKVNVTGGSITALNEKGEPSAAVSDWTATGSVDISDTTTVIGEVKSAVAMVAGVCFYSLQDAINGVVKNNYNAPITLIRDIELNEMVTVPKGANITLNLDGKTITGTDNTEKNFSLIDNRGNLTITGNGTMTLIATVNSGWNRYSAVLANNPGGKLTIENGTFEHLGGTDMAYGIDNLTNGKGTYAETIVNDGTIKSTYRGIRQFLNGIEAQNILTINGGTVEGANRSIWMQDPSKNANTGTLTVSENASLIGDVYLFVTEGSTEWPVEVSIAAAALKDGATVVTGNVPDKYDVKETDGTYGVHDVVAKIGDVKFSTLKAAVEAAQDGDTVVLVDNHEVDINDRTFTDNGYTFIVVEGKEITVDLNGYTLSSANNDAGYIDGIFGVMKGGKLTIDDNSSEKTGAVKMGAGWALIVNYGALETGLETTLTINGGDYHLDTAANSLIFAYKDGPVVVNGGNFYLGNVATGENGSPWIFNVSGQNVHAITVNGGTFNDNVANQFWAFEAQLGEGKAIKDNDDGTWTVADAVATVTDKIYVYPDYNWRERTLGYATLKEAIAAAEDAGDTYDGTDIDGEQVIVTLLDTVNESVAITGNIALDLNEKTLNGAILPSNGDITVKNGSIVNTNGDYSAIEINSGKLTLENVNIDSARHAVRIDGAVEAVINGGEYTLNATSGTRHAVNVSGAANVTIKDGTFIGPKGTTMDSGSAVCVQEGANVTIEGGNFSGGKNATLGVSGTLTVTGGTYDQDASAWCAFGYVCKDNGDGTYSVVSIKPDAYTVTVKASEDKVRYNKNNTPDTFTVEYIVTGGNVIGAMAQYNYDNTLFTCTEDDDNDGKLILYNNDLTTAANGETVIAKLTFTVNKDVEVDTTYNFLAEKVQVTSDYDAAGSGAQDGFVENIVGDEVTVVAQWKVTLPEDNSLAGDTYVDKNTNYSATINNFDENMTYTIKYTMGDGEEQTIEVTKENAVENGFVIENVTGDIVFTDVSYKLNCEIVLVPDYVNGCTLVIVKDGVANGYTYDNAPMYPVARYEGITELPATANSYIVGNILNATSVRAILIEGAVDEAQARVAIKAAASEPKDIEESFDVNGNGDLFFTDAMTAHGCYKEQYDLALELAYYLRADVDTDLKIRTLDYDATVGAILDEWYGEN